MQSIILDSEQKKRYCKTFVDEAVADGSITIEIKNTDKSSTARQRRLQWLWNSEVSVSGMGQDDTKHGVHVRAKWMFARPILLRDDELFGIIYAKLMETIKGSAIYAEYCRDFSNRWISTETMTKRQRAEYLSCFQRYWIGKGVNLTDPALQGVDLSKL